MSFKSKTLVENVVEINRCQGKKPKKQRGKRGVRQVNPKNLERSYQKRLKKLLALIKESVRVNVVAKLPELVAQADIERGKKDSERVDVSVFKQLKETIESTKSSLSKPLSKNSLNNIAKEMAGDTSKFNREKLGDAFKALVGIDLATDDPFMSELLEVFAEDNVELITNVTEDLLSGIQADISQGLRRGSRAPDIAKKILGRVKDKDGFKSRFAKAESRANLIARDQISKLNGDINRQRQENVGVKKFIWRTSNDARVRDSHKLEGEVFTWSGKKSENGKSKPRSGLNPGEDFNCRCYAEPFLEDL